MFGSASILRNRSMAFPSGRIPVRSIPQLISIQRETIVPCDLAILDKAFSESKLSTRAENLDSGYVSIRSKKRFILAPTGCMAKSCLLYTSDAADDLLCVDLGGR